MRLKLAVALLVVSLCSQGCLSFFCLGSSPTDYAANRKVSCLITGIVSGVLLTTGAAAMSVEYVQDLHDTEDEFSLGAGFAGFLLASAGVVPAIISVLHGFSHLAARLRGPRESQKYRIQCEGRGIWHSPHQPGGQSIVGLPDLGHIDPSKLPIQRVNWYWIQQE